MATPWTAPNVQVGLKNASMKGDAGRPWPARRTEARTHPVPGPTLIHSVTASERIKAERKLERIRGQDAGGREQDPAR
jgi:hypothetical protein